MAMLLRRSTALNLDWLYWLLELPCWQKACLNLVFLQLLKICREHRRAHSNMTAFLPALHLLWKGAQHFMTESLHSIDMALIYGIGDVRIERKSFANLNTVELAKKTNV